MMHDPTTCRLRAERNDTRWRERASNPGGCAGEKTTRSRNIRTHKRMLRPDAATRTHKVSVYRCPVCVQVFDTHANVGVGADERDEDLHEKRVPHHVLADPDGRPDDRLELKRRTKQEDAR